MLSKKEQKYIKSLKVKKYRTREKRFLVEGAKNVQELLKSDFKIELLVGTSDFQEEYDSILEGIRFEPIKQDLLAQLGTFQTNDTALAVVEMKENSLFNFNKKDSLFVLDGVGDPGNLGTIIRTLDWFGFTELICSLNCAEFYHPKVISSTMGSFTRVNVHHLDLEQFLPEIDIPIYGADMDGVNVFENSIQGPVVIVMGSESHGISQSIQSHITEHITIPQFGSAESLNVGVATGIIAGYLRMSR